MLAQAAGMAFRFAAVVVLARLLTPADFGLVTMVTSFSLLLVNLGANGDAQVWHTPGTLSDGKEAVEFPN